MSKCLVVSSSSEPPAVIGAIAFATSADAAAPAKPTISKAAARYTTSTAGASLTFTPSARPGPLRCRFRAQVLWWIAVIEFVGVVARPEGGSARWYRRWVRVLPTVHEHVFARLL
ncbi:MULTISPECIES: hypothetical protein [unclassified Streptomyces]|uniref:hypothetical protein n=1 Tax=unclassified Streptomyces TaxID=2593676 RepID=UPI001EEF795A|nr:MULTISPECIES: hypothetical protein [unclassified Streptomyces]